MQYVIDGAQIYTVNNIIIWVSEGKANVVGGSFPIVSGTPSRTLGASTNEVLGYGNGQMLATASGVDSGDDPSGLTAGTIVNVDPNSDDTGQQVWNGMIICDPDLHQFLPVGEGYAGTIKVASPENDWTIRQQFLYCAGTPATDTTVVANQLTTYKTMSSAGLGAKGTLSQNQVMNASGAYESIFSY